MSKTLKQIRQKKREEISEIFPRRPKHADLTEREDDECIKEWLIQIRQTEKSLTDHMINLFQEIDNKLDQNFREKGNSWRYIDKKKLKKKMLEHLELGHYADVGAYLLMLYAKEAEKHDERIDKLIKEVDQQ